MTENIPVIFITGLIDRKECLAQEPVVIDSHAYPVLAKPFEMKELINMIYTILGD